MTDWAFALLALAIACVWLPPVAAAGRALPVWPLPFAAAVGVGVAVGVLAPVAVVALVLLTGLAVAAATAQRARPLWLAGATVLALALAVHAVPGFRNPKFIDALVLSPGARPFTQYLNFDKGAAGLLLVAMLSPRGRTAAGGSALAGPAAAAAGLTTITVLAVALGLGVLGVDPKWPPVAPGFLLANLFFTCVAEEAFFRGVLQSRLPAGAVGIGVSALLFGLVHLPGGVPYACLATLLGLGCAWAFDRTRSVEAPILVHFAFNAVHFLLFTYPMRANA